MTTACKTLFIIFITLLSSTSSAQDHSEIAGFKTGDFPQEKLDIPGLWKVDEVSVGDELLTPTAKWFLFESNGAMSAGNGWVQNALGTWTYNATTHEFMTYDSTGRADEYGFFNLSYDREQMIWQRTEDGVKVKVSLSPVDEKPLGPWDKITGTWFFYKHETLNATDGQGSIADVAPFSYYFGWDRRYRKFDANGIRLEIGIWHIEPHRPWLWMIPNQGSDKLGQSLKFDSKGMVLTIKKGQVTEMFYFRRE